MSARGVVLLAAVALACVPPAGAGCVIQVVGGDAHTLALEDDGTVWAWGIYSALMPTRIAGLTSVVDIAGGEDWSVALRADGTVWAWVDTPIPAQVAGLTDIVQVGGGNDEYGMALQRDGTVWTWFVRGTMPPETVGTDWGGPLTGCLGIAGVGSTWLAVDAEGYAFQWGNPLWGGSVQGVPTPARVTHIAGNEVSGFALLTDGTVWSWSESQPRPLPARVPVLHDVVWLAAGDGFGLAIESDGSVWAWGENDHGQLGDGTTTKSLVPVRVNVPGDPLPGDQGNVLRAVKQLPDVLLDFRDAASLAPSWRLFRDVSKLALGRTPLVPDALVTSFTDAGQVLAAPDLELYRVKGLSPCSHSEGP